MGLIVIGGRYAIEEKKKNSTLAHFTGKTFAELGESKNQNASSKTIEDKYKKTIQSIEDLPKETTKNRIEYLLDHIGDRPQEPSSGSVFHDIIERSKRENTTPVGELFANVKKLMDMGDIVVAPLAIHLANLPDSPSDNFTASYRTLRTMLAPDKICELYHELANKAPSDEEKQRLERATRLFKD